MRLARTLALMTALVAPLAGCSAEAEESDSDEFPSFGNAVTAGGQATGQPTATPPPGTGKSSPTTPAPAPTEPVDPATAGHPEVVYVLMEGKDGWTWYCTGTLVSKDVVVTAAHCLQSDLFLSWEVVAPAVAGRPRVQASSVKMYDPDWDAVEHPDLGIVKLSAPIQLPQYAVLTDVSSRVDSGQQTMVSAIVRNDEQPEAPFEKTGAMKLSSAANLGYAEGYSVPLFSAGGDSGAGMFLIENSKMTHKLVAVGRQPEPSRKLDHLSRVRSTFAQWVARNSP